MMHAGVSCGTGNVCQAADTLAYCKAKRKQSTWPVQVKKILAEFKALGEHHRELGCASALLHEIKVQVSVLCVGPMHILHSQCHHQYKVCSSPIFSSPILWTD